MLSRRSCTILTSAINKLHYTDDPFLTCFLKKDPPFFNPILNRGSWTRTYAIRRVLDIFIEKYTPCQVVSLGAGFDTNYFIMKSKYPTHNFKYIEIDFKEIVDKKGNAIIKSPSLVKLIKNDKEKQYYLQSCDIRDTDAIAAIYKECNISYEYVNY